MTDGKYDFGTLLSKIWISKACFIKIVFCGLLTNGSLSDQAYQLSEAEFEVTAKLRFWICPGEAISMNEGRQAHERVEVRSIRQHSDFSTSIP